MSNDFTFDNDLASSNPAASDVPLVSGMGSTWISAETEGAGAITRALLKDFADYKTATGTKDADVPALAVLSEGWMPSKEMLIFYKQVTNSKGGETLYVHPVILPEGNGRTEDLPGTGGGTTLRAETSILEKKDASGNSLFNQAIVELARRENLITAAAAETITIRICGTTVLNGQVPEIKKLYAIAWGEILNWYEFDTQGRLVGSLVREEFCNKDLVVNVTTDDKHTDVYGRPVFSPVVLTVSSKSTGAGNALGNGGQAEIGRLHAYMDFIPLSPSARKKISKDTDETAPFFKPILHITGVSFRDPKFRGCPSALLGLLTALDAIENTAILFDRVIQFGMKDAGCNLYDYAACGYYSPDKRPFTEIREKEFSDANTRLDHNIATWDSLAIVMDIPVDGPYASALKILATDEGMRQAVRTVTGRDTAARSVGSMSGRQPYGTYIRETDGSVRDTAELTNFFSILTKYEGNIQSVQADISLTLNGFNPIKQRDLQDYNQVLNFITNNLIDNESFKLLGEKYSVLFNPATLKFVREAVAQNHVHIVYKDGSANLGNDLYFGNGGGNTGSFVFDF